MEDLNEIRPTIVEFHCFFPPTVKTLDAPTRPTILGHQELRRNNHLHTYHCGNMGLPQII
jgi:hypothetical protein